MSLGDMIQIVLVKALKGEPQLNAEDLAIMEELVTVFELDANLYSLCPFATRLGRIVEEDVRQSLL